MIQFKTQREQDEYNKLLVFNPKLHALVQALSIFVEQEFNKPVLITSVFRTPAEHAALYAETPADKRPATSPHMRWEALDLRDSIYTPREIEKTLAFLNLFTYQGGQRAVAIRHTIAGNVSHYHLQYGKGSNV